MKQHPLFAVLERLQGVSSLSPWRKEHVSLFSALSQPTFLREECLFEELNRLPDHDILARALKVLSFAVDDPLPPRHPVLGTALEHAIFEWIPLGPVCCHGPCPDGMYLPDQDIILVGSVEDVFHSRAIAEDVLRLVLADNTPERISVRNLRDIGGLTIAGSLYMPGDAYEKQAYGLPFPRILCRSAVFLRKELIEASFACVFLPKEHENNTYPILFVQDGKTHTDIKVYDYRDGIDISGFIKSEYCPHDEVREMFFETLEAEIEKDAMPAMK